MRITYDPNERAKTLRERGLDFEDAALVFAGSTFETEDARKNYGERTIICFGYLGERLVVVVHTPRGADRHVFSVRNANESEKTRITTSREI